MKRIFIYAVLAIVGVFVIGRVTLGESGAMRFIMAMDSLMSDGKFDEACDMYHADLKFHIVDHSGGAAQEFDGGKQAFCDLAKENVGALAKVPHSTNVNFKDVKVKRDWVHPWTSEVSYVENRSTTIRGANVTLNTTSKDTIVLVQTFTGVKLLDVKAEGYVTE